MRRDTTYGALDDRATHEAGPHGVTGYSHTSYGTPGTTPQGAPCALLGGAFPSRYPYRGRMPP